MNFFLGLVMSPTFSKIMRISIVLNIILLTTFQLLANESHGQRINETKVVLELKNQTLSEAIGQLEKKTPYKFVFKQKEVEAFINLNLASAERTVAETLDLLLQYSNLKYFQVEQKILLKTIAPEKDENRNTRQPITGKVVDTLGIGIPGVSVQVLGSKLGTTTDAEGRFTFENLPPGSKLSFRMVGFLEEIVGITSNMRLVLRQRPNTLQEVVINTGYQSMKKERITGSVVTVSASELSERNVTNILNNLEGRVPGLVRYNGNTTIRGIGTLNADANILIVVDGFPIEGGIQNINPYDIEQVTILKDAAAAAIYGARASNGVIVIDTKKAKQNGRTQVEYSTNISIFQKPDYTNYHYMTPAEQVDLESTFADYWFNSGIKGTKATMISTFEANIEQGLPTTSVQYAYYQNAKGLITTTALQDKLNALKQNNFVEDYRANALRNQIIQQYNLGLRTGTERSQSNLVINYKNDNSGIINAYNRQLNLFFKGSYSVAKWMDFNYGINAILGNGRQHTNTSATTPFNVPGYYSLFNADGTRANYALDEFNVYSSYNNTFATEPKLADMGFNHLDELARDFNNIQTRNIRYFIDLNIKPLKGLVIKPQFQYEDNRSQTSAYSEEQSYSMRRLVNALTTRSTTGVYTNLIPMSGRLRESNTNSPSYTARLQGSYDRSFGKHTFSAIAGTEFRQLRSYSRGNILFGYNDQLQTQANTSLDYTALRAVTQTFWGAKIYPGALFGTDVSGFSTQDVMHRFASGFANMTYTYDRRYNLFGSFRKDYADLFGGDKQYRGRPLWSTGASWNINNEEFMKDLRVINNLKLRLSYGVTGNIAMDYTAQLTATISGTNPLSSQPLATISTPPNPKLRWEKTATTNLGLDYALFDARLRGTLDWYRKVGSDLLATTRLDATQGFTQMVINNGDMINNGLEASITYEWFRPGKSQSFGWSSTLNLASNNNKITFVDEVVTNPAVLAGQGAFTIGHPVNSLYSYQFRGLNETGLPLWALSNGTLTTASIPSTDFNAVIFSGGTDPKLSAAFNNEFRYKGWSLNMFMVYYGGHYLRDNPPRLFSDVIYGAAPSYLLNSWTPTNTTTNIPGYAQYYQQPANNNPLLFADQWVKRADFFKVRTLALAYSIPKGITNQIGIADVKLRFQIDNPNIQWSKADLDIDPETRGLRSPTSYVLGVNFNF